jgi:hypothetical protein
MSAALPGDDAGGRERVLCRLLLRRGGAAEPAEIRVAHFGGAHDGDSSLVGRGGIDVVVQHAVRALAAVGVGRVVLLDLVGPPVTAIENASPETKSVAPSAMVNVISLSNADPTTPSPRYCPFGSYTTNAPRLVAGSMNGHLVGAALDRAVGTGGHRAERPVAGVGAERGRRADGRRDELAAEHGAAVPGSVRRGRSRPPATDSHSPRTRGIPPQCLPSVFVDMYVLLLRVDSALPEGARPTGGKVATPWSGLKFASISALVDQRLDGR